MFLEPAIKKIKILALAVVACATFLAAPSAFAATAVDFSGTTVDWNDGENYSLGWSFAANADLYINALGVYAAPDFVTGERLFQSGEFGENVSHSVGIFDADYNLVASTTVSNSDPLNGFFRYHALDNRVILTAGSVYYIAAAMGADRYTWDPGGFSVNSGISFGQNYYVLSDVLAAPTETDGSGTIGYFGPNMDITPTPIPAAAWLLGSGLAGFGVIRRRVGV